MSKVRIPSPEGLLYRKINIGTNWQVDPNFPALYKCNRCDQYQLDQTYYCPECGQKMFDMNYPWEEGKLVKDTDITKHYYNCYLEKEGEMIGWWHYTHIENEEKVPFFIYIHTMDNKTWDGYVTDAWINGPLIRVQVKNTNQVKEFIFYSYHISRTMTDQLP